MSTTTNSVILTMGYTGTDFTRKYQIDDVSVDDLPAVKSKVLAYNANLPEADKSIFISDDYDETEGIGKLKGIVAASYRTVEYTQIPLN